MSTDCAWTMESDESEGGEGFDNVLDAGLKVVGLCVCVCVRVGRSRRGGVAVSSNVE